MVRNQRWRLQDSHGLSQEARPVSACGVAVESRKLRVKLVDLVPCSFGTWFFAVFWLTSGWFHVWQHENLLRQVGKSCCFCWTMARVDGWSVDRSADYVGVNLEFLVTRSCLSSWKSPQQFTLPDQKNDRTGSSSETNLEKMILACSRSSDATLCVQACLMLI